MSKKVFEARTRGNKFGRFVQEQLNKAKETEMKDDSLSDVAFYNTKEGMHLKAKELNIRPYSLGCSCDDCIAEFDKQIDGAINDLLYAGNNNVGIRDIGAEADMEPIIDKKPDVIKAALGLQNIYAKEIWNEAIEAAAKLSLADRQNVDVIKGLKK